MTIKRLGFIVACFGLNALLYLTFPAASSFVYSIIGGWVVGTGIAEAAVRVFPEEVV